MSIKIVLRKIRWTSTVYAPDSDDGDEKSRESVLKLQA